MREVGGDSGVVRGYEGGGRGCDVMVEVEGVMR